MSTETLPAPGIEEDQHGQTKVDYLPLYKVVFWNDDVTTMEFVVRMLLKVFGKDINTAESLMYEVHRAGQAVVDALPLERAEFKVQQVHTAAAMEDFPFTCTIEPA